MSTEVWDNLRCGATWIRGVYMLLFAALFNVAEIVLAAVAIFQFLAQLATGGVNRRLQAFGGNLGAYLQSISAFLTFTTEDKPFPIGPWPSPGDKDDAPSGPLGPGTEAPETGGEPDTKPESG